jgi:hypothetical protein
MRRIFRFFSLAILTFAITSASAQDDNTEALPNFLFPKFVNAIVKFKSGESKKAVINYNIIDEELVFLQENVYMTLDDTQTIDTLFVNDRKFVPFKVGFYEVFPATPACLFIQHKATAEPQGTPNAYGTTSQSGNGRYARQVYGASGLINLKLPDNFKISDASLYWLKKDSSMYKFTNKKQFLKIFKEKEKELTQFIDINNIDFKRSDDVIRLIDYLNELK